MFKKDALMIAHTNWQKNGNGIWDRERHKGWTKGERIFIIVATIFICQSVCKLLAHELPSDN